MAAAVYRAYRGPLLLSQSTISHSCALAIDVELIVLACCISYIIEWAKSPIHIYSNSQSALEMILNMSIHTSQTVSVTTTKSLIKWFESDLTNHLHLHWCPGYSDIMQNKAINKAAKAGLSLPPSSTWVTIAWSHAESATAATCVWAE